MPDTNKNSYNNSICKIRFGILCNGYFFKKWQVKVIENLLESGYTELCLLVINAEASEKS